MIAQHDHHARTHLGDALHRLAQCPGAPGIAQTDDVTERIDGMHAHQRCFHGADLSAHQRKMDVLVHMVFVGQEAECAELGLDVLFGDALH